MNLPLHRLVWALPLVMLAAACSGPGNGIDTDPYPGSSRLDLFSNDQPALTDVAPNRSDVVIPAGDFRAFRVDPSEANRQAVYFLAVASEGFVNVSVEDRNADAIASSSFPSVFESGASALGAARQGSVDQQAISPEQSSDCAHPCVILARGDLDDARYFIVEATQTGDVVVDVYVFSRDLDDLGEFANNDLSGAETLAHSDFQPGGAQGALETLGDVDWYELGGSGCLAIDPADEVSTWVTLHDENGTALGPERQYFPTGDTSAQATAMDVSFGEHLLVSTVEDEAGDAFASTYTLWIDDC